MTDAAFVDAMKQASLAAGQQNWPQVKAHLKPHEAKLLTHPQSAYLVGMSLLHERHNEKGLVWLKRAVALEPKHAAAQYVLGYQLFRANQFDRAIPHLLQATKLSPENPHSWLYLGHCYIELGVTDKAPAAYMKASAIDPKLPRLDFFLANAYLLAGKRAKAEAHIDKAWVMDEQDVAVVCRYATIYGYDIADEHLKHIERLYEKFVQAETPNADLTYTLADIYRKRGEHARAFDFYQAANALRAADEPYEPTARQHAMARTRALVGEWSGERLQGYGEPQAAAVFIVGMPRSGTVALEGMLAAHSQMTGVGEQRLLKQIFYDIAPKMMDMPYPDLLANITPELSQRFGRHYLQAIRKLGDTPFFIDKMPSNFYYIPMIRAILPKAVVLNVLREPIDTCWSIWRHGFEPGHGYSYGFQHLADCYADTQEQIAFYKELFPGFVHDVHYEALLEAPKLALEKVLSLCGLPWEQAVQEADVQLHVPHSWLPVKDKIAPLIDALHARGVQTCVSKGEVAL